MRGLIGFDFAAMIDGGGANNIQEAKNTMPPAATRKQKRLFVAG
jgi:hypothetical protein